MSIKILDEWKNENNKYVCPYCNKEYTKNGMGSHIWRKHGAGQEWTGNNDGFKDGTRTIWNKNLTKYNDDRIKKMSETMQNVISVKKENGYVPGPIKGTATLESRNKMSIAQTNSLISQYSNGRVVSGGYTKWLVYNNIKVQGTYEYRLCIILDKMKENKEIIDWEYTKDRFEYVNIHGKLSKYLLDFKIFLNNSFYYIETKGRVVENDKLKWESVRKTNKLVVMYDADLKREEIRLNIKTI